MEIYFDNSATTCVSAKAADAALRAMREDFGNPSSVHGKGAAAFHAPVSYTHLRLLLMHRTSR